MAGGADGGPARAYGQVECAGKIPALPDGRPVSAGTCDVPGAGTCDLPNCHAPRLAGSGRRYCCTAHTAAGRNLANERSRAAAVERQALTDALDGKTRPPEHVGFLATTKGAVLTGQALLELRAAVSVLRSAAAMADSRTTGSLDRPQFLGRLTAVRRAVAQDLNTPAALADVDAWVDLALSQGAAADESAPAMVTATVGALLGVAL